MYPSMLILISYMEWLFCERTGETKIHFFTLIFCANTSSLIFDKNECNFQSSEIRYLSKEACLRF